jgi:hypothetical protein
MSLTQPSSAAGSPELKPAPPASKKRPRQALLLVLLIIPVVVVWQVLTYRMNNPAPSVAGRPLSNPQTHLHTVALGGSPRIIYLGTHFGLFISYDGGHTWPQQQGILNIAVSPRKAGSSAGALTGGDLISLLVDPHEPQNIYAGFLSPGQVRVSSDGGDSWLTLTQ